MMKSFSYWPVIEVMFSGTTWGIISPSMRESGDRKLAFLRNGCIVAAKTFGCSSRKLGIITDFKSKHAE
jgi:hypothetical protein